MSQRPMTSQQHPPAWIRQFEDAKARTDWGSGVAGKVRVIAAAVVAAVGSLRQSIRLARGGGQ